MLWKVARNDPRWEGLFSGVVGSGEVGIWHRGRCPDFSRMTDQEMLWRDRRIQRWYLHLPSHEDSVVQAQNWCLQKGSRNGGRFEQRD